MEQRFHSKPNSNVYSLFGGPVASVAAASAPTPSSFSSNKKKTIANPYRYLPKNRKPFMRLLENTLDLYMNGEIRDDNTKKNQPHNANSAPSSSSPPSPPSATSSSFSPSTSSSPSSERAGLGIPDHMSFPEVVRHLRQQDELGYFISLSESIQLIAKNKNRDKAKDKDQSQTQTQTQTDVSPPPAPPGKIMVPMMKKTLFEKLVHPITVGLAQTVTERVTSDTVPPLFDHLVCSFFLQSSSFLLPSVLSSFFFLCFQSCWFNFFFAL
jgi:hypothetical protein